MDEQNINSNLAESAVSDIHKDFVVVGKHRVHSWYAWAIVGIVFGMALGIVYVASRSNQNVQFTQSQAAQPIGNQFSIVGAVEANSQIFGAAMFKQGKWLADQNRSKAVTTAGTVKIPTPGSTSAGYGFNVYFPTYRSVGAVLLAPSGKFYVSNGTVINTTQPSGNIKTVYTHKFVAYFLKNGKKTALKVSGSFLPAIDVNGWGAANRLQCMKNGGSLNVPGGIGYYASPDGDNTQGCERGIYFYDIPNGSKPTKHFRAFPIMTPNAQSGTWEFVISERDNSYIIVSKIFTPTLSTGTVIKDTDTDTTTRPTPTQCQPYEAEQDEMFFDCMNHQDKYKPQPTTVVPATPAPATPPQCQGIKTQESQAACAEGYYAGQAAAAAKPSNVAPAKTAVEIQCEARYRDAENIDNCVAANGNY